MKKLAASLLALILIAFAFSSCSDDMSSESASPSTPGRDKGTSEINAPCLNNDFPDFIEGMNSIVSYEYCNRDSIHITASEGANKWSRYVRTPGGRLGTLECDGPAPGFTFAIGMQQDGVHPKLQITFVYTHFYTVTRTMNGVSKTFTINNMGVSPEYPYTGRGAYAYFTDTEVDLTQWHGDITYYVDAINFYTSVLSDGTTVTYPSNIPVMPVPANFNVDPVESSGVTVQTITISWTPTTDQYVTGYEIYRKFTYEADYSLFKTVTPKTAGSATDAINWSRHVPRTNRIYYKMRAVDAVNNRYSAFTTVKDCYWNDWDL